MKEMSHIFASQKTGFEKFFKKTAEDQTYKSLASLTDYSPSHIVQITDFREFLHEYCKGKSETFTKILTCLVRKISFWPAALAKNEHNMHWYGEFTCKWDVTIANPNHKICWSFR